MATLSYAAIKTASTAKENEEKRVEAREKALLLFAFQLLVDKGYKATASTFASECSLDLNQYAMCENIDLNSIFIEFEAYHNLKFQRYPQYFRKITASSSKLGESLLSKMQLKSKQNFSATKTRSNKQNRALLEDENNAETHTACSDDFGIFPSVKSLQNASSSDINLLDDKLLKPVSGLDFPNEDMQQFAEMIQREIVVTNLGVKWSDVIGLESAKMVIMESLVYSKEFTDFFGNAFPPWRGLLLYGPPGNGKTMLAKAVANECKTTFFNISSSTVVSKWRGDSEKLIKVLFQLARFHAPSTIFFDEFDALGSSRDSAGESDASRRFKSELLQQMDGLLSSPENRDDRPVFILAATNTPWDLDPAILRRLEKRIFIPLPDVNERRAIFQSCLGKAAQSVAETSRGGNKLILEVDFNMIAAVSEGYSASDIYQVVKEAIVRKYRESFAQKIKKLVIETNDVIGTIESMPPTVKGEMNAKFGNWDARFGTS